jgi:H2-forming N5,N10-methylenetetrahydromethanopterin dehydrogenase-like enzyme
MNEQVLATIQLMGSLVATEGMSDNNRITANEILAKSLAILSKGVSEAYTRIVSNIQTV